MTRSHTTRDFAPFTAVPRLPLFALLAVKLAAVIIEWDTRFRTRNNLAKLDDHMLEDIGVTRSKAMKEASRPFWLS
ncbi:MAG: DUF1127 domain-containing protein [Pseudomonadota bacterium]